MCAVANRLFGWQRAFFQAALQSLAFQKFHYQKIDAVLVSDIVQSADVGVLQSGNGLGLALEALLEGGVGREVRGQDLDGDAAVEAGVAATIDLSHAASTERGEDFIRAKLGARREGHAWE